MNIDNKIRRKIKESAMTLREVAHHAGTTRQTITNFLTGTNIGSDTLARLCKVFNVSQEKAIEKMGVRLEQWLNQIYLESDPRHYFILIENQSVYVKPLDRILEREFIEVGILDRCKLKSLKCEVKAIDDNSYFALIESTDLYEALNLPFHNINHFN